MKKEVMKNRQKINGKMICLIKLKHNLIDVLLISIINTKYSIIV